MKYLLSFACAALLLAGCTGKAYMTRSEDLAEIYAVCPSHELDIEPSDGQYYFHCIDHTPMVCTRENAVATVCVHKDMMK